MTTYRVVTGPAATQSGRICGAKADVGGDQFEAIISEQAKDGWIFAQVFSHQIKGSICCIIPDNLTVNLLVFKKD